MIRFEASNTSPRELGTCWISFLFGGQFIEIHVSWFTRIDLVADAIDDLP